MNNTLSTRAAFGIVIASLFSAFFAGALVLGIGLSNPDLPQQPYTFISFIVGQGFMLVPLLLFLRSRKEPIAKRLRLRPIKASLLTSTIYLSLGIIIISDELDRIINSFLPAPEYILDLNGLLQPESLMGFVLLFIAVSIIAPLGEELLFRGFFQQVLEEHWKDVTRAVLVTALFFAMIHMNPYWFIQIYILGILLGFLAWRTGSVIPSLVLHSINNTMAMFFSFVDIEHNTFYLFHGHVAPWFILLAVYAVVIGFKGVNRGRE
ncbi:MAG: type II CAAX endopeptidase family protein [Candidatus Marinimicrobia bacterium]|jgi:membrane protease YdiL (CAAX protease family)|nr:type II CAAX endopeptidase family protein [Candidatus Neomarinimicrobiota bacterium]